ncbi:ABC transporter ATP-binding protein/permease [Sphaerisporangium corydalis]|uniref:Transport permease protein n=1 Tax=Sphaerisporangium corydalis TaxID=1441875 RepID=A0ABV9EDP1_9ACTN|nr:ABC transporter ATP-binding protein/permease [Sphaerisporangium corydalis]
MSIPNSVDPANADTALAEPLVPVPRLLAVDGRDLRRRHGAHLAVDGVSIAIPAGGRHGLVGPNGAGKTTLMRMLSATLAPDSGSLRVLGHDAARDPRAVKARIGVVPQGMTYDNEILVRENLTTFGRYHGLSGRASAARADELLATVGLTAYARARPETLSGGMQRRLLIARALVNDPDLILLDEPSTGLDPEGRLLLWDLLDTLCATGKTLVVTTHYMEEVERLCDGVTVLRAGRVRHTASPRRLVAETVPRYVVEVDAPRPGSPVPAWARRRERLRVGNRLLVFDDSATGLAAEADLQGSEPMVRPSSLQDALHALDQRPSADPPAGRPAPAAPRRRRTLYPPSPALAARIWWRDLTLFRKSYKTTIVPNFFEPVFSLAALGIGLGFYVNGSALGSSYANFVAPGLLAVTAMNGAVFEVTYNVFVRLRHARSYDAAVTSPVEPADIALGELMWALTRCLVYTGVYLAIIAAMGYAPAGTAVLAVPALLPLGLVFACAGLIFTGTVRAINAYSYFYTLVLTPLTLLSGVFFPTARLPAPLRAVAEASPLRHGVELARALVTTGDLRAAAGHLAWLTGISLVLIGPALYSLRRHLCS